MEKQRTISKSEFAERMGFSRPYVSKLLREGKITETANGRIDPLEAERELLANTGGTMHGKHGRSLCDDDGSYELDLSTLSDEEGKELLLHAWNQFFAVSELVWKLSRPKRLTKEIMTGIVQGLK